MQPARGPAVSALALTLAAGAVHGANQTTDLSPVNVGTVLPFSAVIQPIDYSGDTMPGMHSFSKAQYNGQWLLIGGMSNGQHNLARTGFNAQYRNDAVYVIDPTTHQVWSRSLVSDPASGLTSDQLSTLMVTNPQFTQLGSHLYIAGGYGATTSGTTSTWQTFNTLSSVDVPGLMNWVKTGTSTAADNIRQINDSMFRVTGGEMLTTSNGRTHLVFGQDYPQNYVPNVNGVYTNQVRSFTIVDDGTNLAISNPVMGPTNADFRRRDLNVVPIIQTVNGQQVDKIQALAGVFTTSFGVWTVPVTIDGDGYATEPDPALASTLKQGMNSYRCANIGLYSVTQKTMHTLLFGGISLEFYDSASGTFKTDSNVPYVHDATDIITDANGNMTLHQLPNTFPTLVDSSSGKTLYLGTETEFFLADGVPTFSNGVIDLDALTGPTLVGYFFGGIASDAPNFGSSQASNGLFPVIITPQGVPEPSSLVLAGLGSLLLLRRRDAHKVRV